MSTTAGPQQSDWNTNIYTLTITRILIVLGVTYLIRSLVSYFFQTLPSATRIPSTDGESMGLQDVDAVVDVLNTASSGPNTGTDVNLDLELGLQPPQRSYNPRDRQQRVRTEGSGDSHTPAASPSLVVSAGALGQDAMVHDSRTPNDEPSTEVSTARSNTSSIA